RRGDRPALRPLPEAARLRYLESWRTVQAQFVDNPIVAVRDADVLVTAVMVDRGYATGEERLTRAIRESIEDGDATTEDLRQALRHYRALFEELLDPAADEPLTAERELASAEAATPAIRKSRCA